MLRVQAPELLISIHAPVKGATSHGGVPSRLSTYFNPRSREGSDNTSTRLEHQSPNFNPRSREGSDFRAIRHMTGCNRFQSTLP